MPKPFKKLKSLGKAFKVGYRILQRYEALEAAGLVPELKIKGIPVTAIDDAAEVFVRSVKAAKEEEKEGATLCGPTSL